MNTRKLLACLLAAAVALPVIILVVLAAGRLLAGMDDAAGAQVLGRVALAGGVLWAVVLVGLPIVQALDRLMGDDQRDDEIGADRE